MIVIEGSGGSMQAEFDPDQRVSRLAQSRGQLGDGRTDLDQAHMLAPCGQRRGHVSFAGCTAGRGSAVGRGAEIRRGGRTDGGAMDTATHLIAASPVLSTRLRMGGTASGSAADETRGGGPQIVMEL